MEGDDIHLLRDETPQTPRFAAAGDFGSGTGTGTTSATAAEPEPVALSPRVVPQTQRWMIASLMRVVGSGAFIRGGM